MTIIQIPNTVGEAKKSLATLGGLLTAKQWERAAIVYAFTEEGKSGPASSARKGAKLSFTEFAEIGITGLEKRDTVAKYHHTWAQAVENGEAPHIEPGDRAELPTVPWPDAKKKNKSTALVKATKESNRVRARRHIRAAGPKGLTEPELKEIDPVLAKAANIRGDLVKDERDGVYWPTTGKPKRGGHKIYVARSEEEIPPRPETKRKDEALERKIEKISKDLQDPDVREGLKARAGTSRTAQQDAAAVRAFEKAEEQRRVAQEKEAAALAKVEHEQAMKRNEYWFALQTRLDAFHNELAPYIREFDNLPDPHRSVLQGVDRRIDDLVNSLRVLQSQMFPGRVKGKGGLKGGTVIDISEAR